MTAPGVSAGARAPLGSVRTVRTRLALQPRRPLLVRAWAALLGDAGLLGPAARRRAAGRLVRSLPGLAAAGTVALVGTGELESPAPGLRATGALAVFAVALGAVVWRRTARAAAGERAGLREQAELGALFVAAAYAMSRAVSAGAPESQLQPLVYLVMAFLVAFLDRRVGFALVLGALGLELLVWRTRGGRPGELPAAIVHAGFVTLFAVLYHGVLAAQVASARRAEQAAVDRRLREIDERARELRLTAPVNVPSGADHDRRWVEASVVEVEARVRGLVEIAEIAMRSHTCAVYQLSADDAALTLRECRSRSDAVARGPIPAGEGILGGVVRRRQAVRLHGRPKPPSYYADGTRPGAILAVPLVDRGDHVRGALVVDRIEAVPFDDDEEALLRAVAAEVLRAEESERLIASIKQSRDEQERFYAAMRQLNGTRKPVDVFDETLRFAAQMVPLDFGAVTVAEGEGDRRSHRIARVACAPGTAGGDLEGRVFHGAGGLVEAAMRHRATLTARDRGGAAHVLDDATPLPRLGSVKVIPLESSDRVLGTVVLGARAKDAFPPEAIRQLEVVAMQAAESIQRAALFEENEKLATTDGLTGLTNHRVFQRRLDEHLALARRYGKKLSVLLCDIDHFKAVNDTHGHPAGDVVLRGVARALAREARAADVVARYGGEEFAVIMPETDGAGAAAIAERIRARVGEAAFDTERGALRVTLSLGVATVPDDAPDKPALVERADACLYHAKRHGRNQTVTAGALRSPARATG